MGSYYNPNPEYTIENPNCAELTLSIRRRSGRRRKVGLFKYLSTFTVGSLVSHIKIPGYTLENTNKAERDVTRTIRLRKGGAFQICIHFYCGIIGVSFTQNPGYTLENPK